MHVSPGRNVDPADLDIFHGDLAHNASSRIRRSASMTAAGIQVGVSDELLADFPVAQQVPHQQTDLVASIHGTRFEHRGCFVDEFLLGELAIVGERPQLGEHVVAETLDALALHQIT